MRIPGRSEKGFRCRKVKNSHTVVRLGDCRVLKSNSVNGVVVTATNTANRQTVASRASTTAEGNLGTRVDSNAVILVVHLRTLDLDIVARANVEAISVVAAPAVTGGVVNGHIGDGQAIAAVDADGLHGCVFDVQVRDARVGQRVRGEELGLRLAAVAALRVPPAGSVGVQLCTGGSLDGDALALDLEERAFPFLVAPGGGALEDDLSRLDLNVKLVNHGLQWCRPQGRSGQG